ncbi:Hypothetical predicted protein [Olea europaea subsp. europaea]|uniref:Uncharacterized protein n=1 Tax=Olea europaea subsp. europaea TaxID=158383 RepID=A0A8S0RLD5_OLEEU|nr:Hypothetical predicted protein [Olea europaea subsp. europaea]
MGVTKKQGGKESEGNIWSIAGIPVRVPLKSTSTKPKEGYEDYEECCSTPLAREFKMPEMFTCPEAPRKRRPSLNCEGYDKCVMTPPAREFKMPEMFTCPAAPRKRRPSLNCEDYDKCVVTPPAREFKIPETFTCPAAPRKRRLGLNCHFYGVWFSNSPDWESVCLYSPF